LHQALLDRPGNADIQLTLLYDYRNNPPQYSKWQAYLRERQPPMLVVWGKNDPFFTVDGAQAYSREVPKSGSPPIQGRALPARGTCRAGSNPDSEISRRTTYNRKLSAADGQSGASSN
jgi:hypothetical protein